MRISKSVIAAACMAALSCTTLPAHAGLFDDDEARKAILDLRAKLDALQQAVDARLSDKADKNGILDIVNQNEQLRQDIARLRGQVEVLSNDLAEEQKREKDFYNDLDTRLRNLEPKKVNVNGKEAEVEPNEQKAYENATSLFKSGDYKGAGVALNDFVRRFPQSAYVPEAQYTLGNDYYIQNDFRNALTVLQALVKNSPQSPRAPEALLTIATCYIELKDKIGAKRALDLLIDQYPDAEQAQTAKDRLRLLK